MELGYDPTYVAPITVAQHAHKPPVTDILSQRNWTASAMHNGTSKQVLRKDVTREDASRSLHGSVPTEAPTKAPTGLVAGPKFLYFISRRDPQSVTSSPIHRNQTGDLDTSELNRRGVSDRLLIGYRHVPKVDVDKYITEGNTIKGVHGNGYQIGSGAYVAGGTHDWIPGEYMCLVWVDRTKWAKLRKIWIPKYDHTKSDEVSVELWDNRALMDDYIRRTLPGADPAQTIRFGRIMGPGDMIEKTQLVIPPAVQGSVLGIHVQCSESAKIKDGALTKINYRDRELIQKWQIHGISPDLEQFTKKGDSRSPSPSKSRSRSRSRSSKYPIRRKSGSGKRPVRH
ncbi:unnamed protein product [Cyclocybe aegerita]|uniref:Uncharacterized protein n=1 Tax=Cyclocybe aegerita TaxID=1973307 RepID=A0A8S0XYE1_CYCAE|nr:unnamed protein product [Cyclocybe aegerita]